MSTVRTVAWRGVDDPDRLDSARISFAADSLRAAGASVAPGYRLSWSLHTGPGWITERFHAEVLGDEWYRRLDLTRTSHGDWHVTAFRAGAGGPDADPGCADPAGLGDATDVDLGLCPVTNLMPVLRMGYPALLRRKPVPVAVAWVDVPSLAVRRDGQSYGPITRRKDGAHVRFASSGFEFSADLPIDEWGLVRHYPGLAHRL